VFVHNFASYYQATTVARYGEDVINLAQYKISDTFISHVRHLTSDSVLEISQHPYSDPPNTVINSVFNEANKAPLLPCQFYSRADDEGRALAVTQSFMTNE